MPAEAINANTDKEVSQEQEVFQSKPLLLMQERIRAVELMGKSLRIFEKTDFQMHEPLPWAD